MWLDRKSRNLGDRPILRASATDVPQTRKGLCGAVSRAFTVLAGAPLYLYGKRQHVVAVAKVGPGEFVTVDAPSPPIIAQLEPLDHVILHPQFHDYSTMNLGRLDAHWLAPRLKLDLGPVGAVLERPALIQAALWLLVAATALALRLAARISLAAAIYENGTLREGPKYTAYGLDNRPLMIGSGG